MKADITENTVIHMTPTGVLAAAFVDLVADAKGGSAWWAISPLLSATGLAYHLDKLGWTLVPKEADDDAS